jgi:hypothetical protein
VKAKYAGLEVNEAKRLRVLEHEYKPPAQAPGRGCPRWITKALKERSSEKGLTPVVQRTAVRAIQTKFQLSERWAVPSSGSVTRIRSH